VSGILAAIFDFVQALKPLKDFFLFSEAVKQLH
jgi:hypothetical protein